MLIVELNLTKSRKCLNVQMLNHMQVIHTKKEKEMMLDGKLRYPNVTK